MAKFGWCLSTKENKFWVQALKAKYFPHSFFMKYKKKCGSSWLWFGVLRVKSLLAKGLFYKIGKVDSVNFQKILGFLID